MAHRRWILAAFVPVLMAGLLLAAEDEGKKYALLVGVQRYSDGSGLRNLGYTEKDVTDLGVVLTKQGYHVTVLTRSEAIKQDKDFLRPTAKNIRDHMKTLTARCKSGDVMLVGVSGHGVHLKKTDKLYFCPQESDLKDQKSLVAIQEVMASLRRCKATSKVFLMDACRNDPADGASGEKPADVGSVTRPLVPDLPGGTVALFSCSKGQTSHESKKHNRGFLFHHVIEGLGGKAANKKTGEVTWLGLANYVEEELPDAVSKEKGPKVIQTPEVRGSARSLVLARTAVKASDPKPGEERSVEIAKGVDMVFCWIPAGTARLGSPKAERDEVMKQMKAKEEPEWLASEAEDKRGKYTTKGFWLGKYPVTQEEWQAVVKANLSEFDGKKDNKAKGLVTTRFPVEKVSWNESVLFIMKLNDRRIAFKALGMEGKLTLPHEDEWEYAYRGGKGNKIPFYWGDKLNGTQAHCNGTLPYGTDDTGPYLGTTTVVGKYKLDAPHPWGLCDMSGNVYQWCENLYSSDKIVRVVRGGAWNIRYRFCRGAYRAGREPNRRLGLVGVRLCFRVGS